jgi:hypothetical protein
MAQKPVWTRGDYRTDAGQALVLAGNARLEALGKTRSDKKAVHSVILGLIKTEPAYKGLNFHTLKGAYNRALHKLSPPVTEEDQWTSTLQKWGMSPENARELVDRLIAVTIAADKRADLGQLFDYVGGRRVWNRGRKVEWLRHEAYRIETRPHYWPLANPRRPQRADINAEQIKAVLRRGPSTNRQIAAATGIKLRTVETLLYSMRQTNEVVPVGHGKHALPSSDIAPYLPPSRAALKALRDGSASPAELCARTGLSKSQIAGALHWLWKHKKIVRIRPNLWGLPGTAPSYIIARDAIIEALQSGSKIVSELVAATGKNRGAIWQALRRLIVEGLVIQAYLVHGGRHRGRLAAFAIPRA